MSRFVLAAAALLFAASPVLAADDDHGHGHEPEAAGHQDADHHDHEEGDHDDGVHAHDHEHGVSHVFTLDGLRVVHPWTRATTERDAFLFMDLHNTSDAPVTLLGAEADWATGAEIVGFRLEAGEGQYTTLPPLPVAAGRDLMLRPQEVAIRFTGLSEPLPQGGHVHLTLRTSLGDLDMAAMIEAADAMQHSHAGHSHLEEHGE